MPRPARAINQRCTAAFFRAPLAVNLVVFAGLLWLVACASASAQVGNTVLPTDIAPTGGNAERQRAAQQNALQLRLWQHLPASFFFNSTVETTFRVETNPFQNPMKRTLLHHAIPAGTDITKFTAADLQDLNAEIGHSGATDSVFRINPNVTAGWAVTPNTQVFANYFLLRDSLFYNSSLNSTTKAVGLGAQSMYTIGSKVSVQPQILMRELYQTAEPDVFDYLPSLTMQYQNTPNLVTYVNALMQVRMKHFIGDSQREMNPFYTIGWVYQRGRWQFSANGTFIQNVRKPFNNNAIIPINNDSFVLDFEVDRQPFESIPGLQTFVRAEPVYNFGSHGTPGLAGMDFRLYYGLRMTVTKPPINGTMQQLMQRYRRQSGAAPGSTPAVPNGTTGSDPQTIRNDIANQL